MPASLFFDISKLDLNAIALSSDEVGRLNPQTGDMRQLDHVIWANPECTLALGFKAVRPDEFWTSVHVPGRPLMPGVLMIEAGAQLCSVMYKKKTGKMGFLGFTHCDNVVFRKQVVPGDSLYLLGREYKFGVRRFTSEVQGVVGNELVFEASITGMAV